MSAAPVTAPPISAPCEPPRHAAVSWPEARRRAHSVPRPLVAGIVYLAEAPGFTPAEELAALHPLPSFDTAAMDGYAVAGRGPWRVRAAVRAGTAWPGELGAGECVEISTGAQVPAGACAVLPLEAAAPTGDQWVRGPVLPTGRHIRRVGEDASAGTPLAPAGTRIGPALVGLAAACGHDSLAVRPRPQIGVLITGDELDGAGVPGPGRVRDALGPALPALIAQFGGDVTHLWHVPDRPTGLLARAVHAMHDADVVLAEQRAAGSRRPGAR